MHERVSAHNSNCPLAELQNECIYTKSAVEKVHKICGDDETVDDNDDDADRDRC